MLKLLLFINLLVASVSPEDGTKMCQDKDKIGGKEGTCNKYCKKCYVSCYWFIGLITFYQPCFDCQFKLMALCEKLEKSKFEDCKRLWAAQCS